MKHFETEREYNQCAGLLSPPIVEVLEKRLGVEFPYELVQRTITNYLFRGNTETISLSDGGGQSLALRRVQFDRYLSQRAALCGARIIRERVRALKIDQQGVHISCEGGSKIVDVVVGAFGLDDGTSRAFHRATGYQPPPYIETLVTKLHPPAKQMERYGQTVYAFLPPIRRAEFAAVIPKGNHLTIVLAGTKLTTEAMDRLFKWGPVREIVRPEECQESIPQYYKGRFPTSWARRVYGERHVIVGDAAGLVRPFKGKGVTTACMTGYLAAVTMMDVGIGKRAMRRFYAECRELTDDIFFGRVVRLLVRLANRTGAVDELIRQAREDHALRAAMYCCVSGEGAFRRMLFETAGFRRAGRVSAPILRGLLRRQQSHV
jgi:flavin-dependent dehydrogenase